MILKSIVDEDFINYKKPSMFIVTAQCDFKCDRECGKKICQNSPLAKERNIIMDDIDIVRRYMNNPITEAIVFGGLEPLDTVPELLNLMKEFRQATGDDIVIYTGYKEVEIEYTLEELKRFDNVIVKFGRYIPNDRPIADKLLGVTLASSNQYAKRIS